MNNKIQPAVLGGLLLGFLSAIPFVNMLNTCCCAWAIIGCALAAFLYIKKSPTPVTLGEGALLGVIAGVIGGIIYMIVGIPLGIMTGNAMGGMATEIMARVNPSQAEAVRAQIEAAQGRSFIEQLPGALVGGLVGFVLLIVFATIGGVLGAQFLEKRKGGGQMAPPPPPNFTNQPPPNYGNYGR